MRARPLWTILISLALAASCLSAPVGQLALSLSDFEEGKYPHALEHGWLFHSGNNPLWASPDYDDSKWTSHSSAFRSDDAAGGSQTQLCWFRLHLNLDSALATAGLYLAVEQQGALEIYFNGLLVYERGTVGDDAASEEIRICNSFEPVRLEAKPNEANLLAVRYSNHSDRGVVRLEMQPGFRIFLRAGKSAGEALKQDRDLRIIGWSLIAGLGLALTALHLLLFLSYKVGRENLYFAAYSASIMLFSLLIVHAWYIPGWTLTEANHFQIFFRVLLVVMAMTGMRFMQSVRGLSSKKGDRLVLALLILGCLTAWLTTAQVAYIICLIACIELVRSLWIAMRLRLERIWIIGIGFALLVPMVAHQLIIEFGWIRQQSWHEYPPMLVLLAMSLSMSAYLGSRFAAVNRSLETKISELDHSREALAESEARYRSMFENTVAGVGILDDQGVTIFANDRWIEILGAEPEDVLGQDARKQVASSYLEEINRRLGKLYTGQASQDTYEFEIIRADGRSRMVQVWATPYKTESGKIHLALHSMDVTDTREAERMQREAIQLAEKTARMASIGVMAGGITHEINQPLNAIMLHAETLQFMAKAGKLDQTDHVNTALDHIIQGTERISNIIQHMRSFWVAPAQSEGASVDLNDPVRQGLLLLEQRVRSHAIRFKIDVDPGPLLVCADPLQVEQIVVNLISNSINSLDKVAHANKFVSVRTYGEDDEAILEVRDNGVGLPAADLDKIFDPFYSTDKEAGGTGLGLAIVQMFVEKFKGAVHVENNSDGGATFQVRIPKCHENE
jgi:PAS domain S-box-containing protein